MYKIFIIHIVNIVSESVWMIISAKLFIPETMTSSYPNGYGYPKEVIIFGIKKKFQIFKHQNNSA